jgi:hypothetical protein
MYLLVSMSTVASIRSRLRPYDEALEGARGVSSTLLIWRDTCHTAPGHKGGSDSVSEDDEMVEKGGGR